MVNIAEPLSCIFYCSALLIYFSDVSSCRGSDDDPFSALLLLKRAIKKFIQIIFWISFLVLSILFKETGITLLGIVFGFSFLNIVIVLTRKITSCRSVAERKNSLSVHIFWILVSLTMLVGYFVFRALIVSRQRDMLTDFKSSDRQDILSAMLLTMKKVKFLSEMAGNSITMLKHLLLLPFLSLKKILQGLSHDINNSPIGEVVDISSFYLDDSQLIRKAENPFAFLNGQEKVFSLMYLHFRYFFLLLWPVELAPEYAFNCIPSVATWEDEGNYRVLYAVLLYVVIIAASLYGFVPSFLSGNLEICHTSTRGGTFCTATLLSVMLMVISFVPAAGVNSHDTIFL